MMAGPGRRWGRHHSLQRDHPPPSAEEEGQNHPPEATIGGEVRPWRPNKSLFQRPSFVKQIEQAISRYLALNDVPGCSVSLLWEALKAVIRGELIAITATDNKIRKEKRETMTKQVLDLEQIHKCTGAPGIWRRLEAACTQLAGLDQDRAEYAPLRMHHSFYVGGKRMCWLLASCLCALR
ncbi:hypothetical protein NDU88_004756 [Pleurodeles waltl]|uniref:Uncharacterized protein n=1 Tax=Pleurodeles waltl TaxID=8319 RepID=A0AAV7V4C1_PLEWA|nr:hypothetical protein NDU88_004756 [Pleurodeles waltl]